MSIITSVPSAISCEYELEIAGELLKFSADVEARNYKGDTSLIHALENKTINIKIIKQLLKSGYDIEAWNYRGSTPLIIAIENYSTVGLNVIKTLVDHGADVNSRNYDGEYPLSIAVSKGNVNFDVLYELISHGADIENGDQEGNTTLSIALKKKTVDIELINKLLNYGANVNARNYKGDTPLNIAVRRNKSNFEENTLEVIKVLLCHGADVNVYNNEGHTPLYIEIRKNIIDIEVVQELLAHGANINIKTENLPLVYQHSCLDYTVGNVPCAKLLIKFTLLNTSYTKISIAIDLSTHRNHPNCRELLNFQIACVYEIRRMKIKIIENDLSLYGLVSNNPYRSALLNNRLSVKVSNMDLLGRYPIYQDIINSRLQTFLERAKLLNKLKEVEVYTKLDTVTQDFNGKIILDFASIYNVSQYLTDNELYNLITAFDVPKSTSLHDFVSTTFENSGRTR